MNSSSWQSCHGSVKARRRQRVVCAVLCNGEKKLEEFYRVGLNISQGWCGEFAVSTKAVVVKSFKIQTIKWFPPFFSQQPVNNYKRKQLTQAQFALWRSSEEALKVSKSKVNSCCRRTACLQCLRTQGFIWLNPIWIAFKRVTSKPTTVEMICTQLIQGLRQHSVYDNSAHPWWKKTCLQMCSDRLQQRSPHEVNHLVLPIQGAENITGLCLSNICRPTYLRGLNKFDTGKLSDSWLGKSSSCS